MNKKEKENQSVQDVLYWGRLWYLAEIVSQQRLQMCQTDQKTHKKRSTRTVKEHFCVPVPLCRQFVGVRMLTTERHNHKKYWL